jgi:hypothetical protein
LLEIRRKKEWGGFRLENNTDIDNLESGGTKQSGEQKNVMADFIFTIILSILLVVFLIDAVGFHPVARRAPMVVMIPLILLIIIQIIRLTRVVSFSAMIEFIAKIFNGKEENYKKVFQITLWMIVLIASIYVVGHYVGSALFLFVLLRIISREKWSSTLLIMVIVPVILYVLFEYLLGLQLYRGILYLLWRGYDVF